MKYRTVLADPPWRYGDALRMDPLVERSSMDHYDTMTIDDICALADANTMPVGGNKLELRLTIAGFEIDHPAFLFLWVTSSFLLSGDGLRVCHEWGFEPKQLITWVKTKKDWTDEIERYMLSEPGSRIHAQLRDPNKGLQLGMGRYTRGVTEHLILATRGKCTALVKSRSVRNVIFAPRREHSRKPDKQYELIEELVPGPYLELFATHQQPGWTAWGKELG